MDRFKEEETQKEERRWTNSDAVEFRKARKEQEEERIRLQSAQYYELNKPTREWTLNSHLLDTDYDNDDNDYGT